MTCIPYLCPSRIDGAALSLVGKQTNLFKAALKARWDGSRTGEDEDAIREGEDEMIFSEREEGMETWVEWRDIKRGG